MNILIKNSQIVTMDKEKDIIENGYVLIENNYIKKVGCGNFNGSIKNTHIIDGSDYIVLPGLVNCHTHAAMTLLRGYGEGLPLMRWLNEKIWPIERKFKEKHIRIGTELAVIEMLRTGTTTFNDMYFMQNIVWEVVEELKMRAVLGVPLIGEEWEQQLKNALHLSNKINAAKSNLVKSLLAPHSPYTLSQKALISISEISKEEKKDIHIHIAETQDEVNIIKNKYNITPCEFLNNCGLFRNNVIGAHCIHLNDSDIEILNENKVNVVYNPQSNMKLSSGVARINEMYDKGINICIGTDGASSNNNLNLIEEMETGSLLQKLWYKDPTILNGKEMLEMATVNGARALGYKNLGLIKRDYIADIIMIKKFTSSMMPLHNIYSNIIFSANGSEVDYVIINGKLIMEKGVFKNIDEEKIIYESNKICKETI